MPLYVYVAAAMVCAGVIVLIVSLQGIRVPANLTRSNLANATGRVTNLRDVVLARPSHERLMRPAVASLANTARRITPRGFAETLDRRIHQAGLSERWPIDRVLVSKLELAIVGGLLGAIKLVTDPSPASLLLLVAATVAGFLIPDLLISMKARERQELIARELPDVLDQVTICVEAGLGFDAALSRVASTSDGPLAEELQRTMSDMSAGVPRAQALRIMGERVQIPEIRQLVTALVQAQRHGVPLAETLRIQSTEMRSKKRQHTEEKAAKLAVKMIFPIIFCFMPVFMIVSVLPTILNMIKHW